MAKYWSAAKAAFYDDAVMAGAVLPEDAVVITEDDYKAWMAKQDAGYVIVAGADGYPAAIEQTCGHCTCLQHDTLAASADVLGHVKIGPTLMIAEDGTIDVARPFGKPRDRAPGKPTYGLE